jgi:O-acetyl-ADP-ribose deacetylase (regulator of RNase III)
MSGKIDVIQDDITKLNVDAIVNAANASLRGGGGVDGAIHRAAGPELLEECIALNGCETGDAKITGGYDLPARYVIHTVGPVYGRDPDRQAGLLRSCYTRSLELAAEKDCKSVAFPNISTGIYGYPKDEAAEIAVKAVRTFLSDSPEKIDVIFVCFDSENFSIYQSLLS